MNLIKVLQAASEWIQKKLADEETCFFWDETHGTRWFKRRIWTHLARSRHVSVRCIIAGKRCMPESVLSDMLADPDKRVRGIAAHNPMTPWGYRKLTVLDEEEEECLRQAYPAQGRNIQSRPDSDTQTLKSRF